MMLLFIDLVTISGIFEFYKMTLVMIGDDFYPAAIVPSKLEEGHQ